MPAQVRWVGRHQTLLWTSEGLSEAEDWLGREASRPWGDPGRHLYRTYAAAKKRKPSTCRERGCWTELPTQAPRVPVPLRVLRPPTLATRPLFLHSQSPARRPMLLAKEGKCIWLKAEALDRGLNSVPQRYI